MRRILNAVFASCLLIPLFWACSGSAEKKGPFFGNGFRNGWADQHSVVIWTRLTRTPELNRSGPPFKLPETEANKLAKLTSKEQIMKEQLPDGYTLDQMEGACPGANGEVKLTWFAKNSSEEKEESGWMKVNPEMDFTHQWRLEKLKSGTEYTLKLYARATETSAINDSIEGFFQTPPDSAVVGNLRFCIVTCHDYPRRDEPVNGHKIYTAMLKQMPHFYVHTGDVEYYDKPYPYALTEELMRFKWNRIFALPNQRLFFTEVTTYFMKDDHDVLRDDAYPGMNYGQVSFGRGLEIFDKEQFPSNDKPYKTVRWGKDLQIWIMEGRNFRSPNNLPDGPGKTIWGAEQKAWLFRTLKESNATFKLVIVSSPILGPDRKNKKDNYSNAVFKTEGDEIRQELNQYKNLVILNGDRHWQYVTHPRETNLWEFSCGAGSDAHAEGWPPGEIRPEHRFLRVRGGYLYGTTKTGENGNILLTLQHCDVDGNVVHEEVFNANDQNNSK